MRRFVLACACVAVLGAAAINPVAASAAWSTKNQHQLVPAYFYPDWWNATNNWARMCGAMNTNGGASTAIMNPNSGPLASPDYARVLEQCHTQRQQVIGYVHTSYGARPLAAVQADIDAYYAFYPGIDGIFLDEMSNDSATRAYYQSLYALVHGKPGPHQVVGNPGAAASSAWQLTTPVADAVVVFEDTAARYLRWSPPAWVRSQVASKISNLVHAATSQNTMREVCSRSENLNAGYMYVTGDALPNPWDTLPVGTYWTKEVSAC